MGGGVVGVVGVGVVVGVVGVGVAKSACFAFADPCDKRLVLPEQVRFVISLAAKERSVYKTKEEETKNEEIM
tara:strand:- start:811 stop:1026 length:216 start_codon:yes stop_codon:yes gene_type:complete